MRHYRIVHQAPAHQAGRELGNAFFLGRRRFGDVRIGGKQGDEREAGMAFDPIAVGALGMDGIMTSSHEAAHFGRYANPRGMLRLELGESQF